VVDHTRPCTTLVYDTLRAWIVGGEIAPGERLPSCVVLAGTAGAAAPTVRQVLARSG
jgi:DNA-binding GntR family transcriptional regulator